MKFNLKNEIRFASRWLKRNGSTICSIGATVGTILTGYFAYQASDNESDILFDCAFSEREYSDMEVYTKIFWKPVVAGAGTIACIWLGHGIDQKQLAAMTAGYLALRKSYQEYREQVKADNPELDKTAKTNIAKENWDKTYPNEAELYWDAISNRYFTASPLQVEKAKYELNKLFAQTGTVTINDLYTFLGISKVPGGDCRGWDTNMFDVVSSASGDYWIDFVDETYEFDDGNGETVEVQALETDFYPMPLIGWN